MSESVPPIASPGSVITKFVVRILGFGVWVAIGLAPFLGRKNVPGFTAVIAMYPVELQDWLIPLSGLLMGMLALIVEYAYYRKRPSDARIHRWFVRTVAVFVVSFVALIAVYLFTVVRINKALPGNPPERVSLAVITGSLDVPQQPGSECGCRAGQPADVCVGNISLDPANIRSCFSGNRIALATLALALLYLTVTGAFAWAVGIQLVARRRAR